MLIKRDVDGKAQSFPTGEIPAIIGTFTYTAKRMGGAPSITATIYYPTLLDKRWTHEEYVEFQGERYYATSIPSSSKDNQSVLYKHDVTFTSRREILDNTLFFDAVSNKDEDTKGGDKYRTNQTRFSFGGDITEFVSRINSSMKYCDVPYSVVIDDGYATTDVKEVSFENQYLTEVLQLINTTYQLDYYWVGNVCHVGKLQYDLTDNPIEYGRNNALVSVSKENSNARIVDMITGYGSSDNIPYYYPNDDEFGKADYISENINEPIDISLSQLQKNASIGTDYAKKYTLYKREGALKATINIDGSFFGTMPSSELVVADGKDFARIAVIPIVAKKGMKIYEPKITVSHHIRKSGVSIKSDVFSFYMDNETEGKYNGSYTFTNDRYAALVIWEHITIKSTIGDVAVDKSISYNYIGSVEIEHENQSKAFWLFDGGVIEYESSGISVNNIDNVTSAKSLVTFEKIPNADNTSSWWGFKETYDTSTEEAAAKITIKGRNWIFPSQNLMPSVYRESGGAERFYYAKNDTYSIPGATDKYTFKNIYKEGNPHQGSVEFSDIKPTINGVRNDVIQSDGLGQLFGEIAGVAFDSNDSDVKNDDSEYIHSYFYIKLHKFSGSYGFDLFKHALASESAKINLIKSNGCPACSFDIQCVPSKDKSKMYNCVSTDGHGNLKSVRDDCNDYIFKNDEDAYKDTFNQDSTKTELWIAVKKDDSTLGIIMPNASGNFKPQKGDLFVITGINPPKVLVTAAEKRLDEALIKYMSENNEDKFNYSVKFSRIFLQENMAFANKLNENSKVAITYAGEKHEYFVTNYTVKVDDSALADVEIELSDTLDASSSELKKAIDAVKGETAAQLQGLIGGSGGLNATIANRLYLSKQGDDTAQGLITFAKGLISEMLAQLKGGATFGKRGYKFDKDGNVVVDAISSLAFDEALERGFGITKNTQGKYTLSVTDLMVWGKAVFNSLEIRKLYAVGGNVYLSGASSKIVRAVPVKKATAAASSTGGDASETWVACAEGDADCEGWKCYTLNDDGTTATQNGWRKYDQAKCQTFDIEAGTHEGVSNTFYWRLVADVSTKNETITETRTETYVDVDGVTKTREVTVDLYDGKKFGWVILSKTDCESTANDAPKAGDTIVLDGHRMFASGDAEGRDQYNDESRTNVMMLETTGVSDGSLPRIVALTGITDYRHSDGKNEYSNTVFILSPKEVVFVSSSIKWISASGDPITLVNFRGNWAEGTKYGYYDQVSHNNAIWTCIVEKGTTTTEEPSDTSAAWRKEISGGKGEKGDPAVTYELEATPSYIKLDADGSFDRSNQYREGQMLLVRGYKIVGGKRITQWGDADNPISIQISFNDGAAWYESTFNNGESGLDEVYNDFEPTCEDSYFSMLQEMKKNGLKNCKAVMYEGESLDPDKIPSDKVLARIDIPIVQDGKDGASGTSYGVTLTVEKRTISSVEDDCLVVTFTKGDTDGVTTTNNVQDIGGYAQLYVDGKIDTSVTARLNLGTSEAGELQKGAFPQVFTAGYVTVKWYDKEGGTLLGMGSLTRGADGKDATVYGVQVSSYYEWISSGNMQQGLQFGFTKTTGTTVKKYTDVTKMGCTVKIFGDDTLYDNVSRWINEGNDNFLFSSFPYNNVPGNPTLADKSVISVELYHDYVLLATANYANGKQGADGKGALEIICAPETIVLDTDDNGLVKDYSNAWAGLMCVRDGKVVDDVTYDIGSRVNCEAIVNNVGVVKITKVNTQTVTIDGNTVTVSSTSGSVTVSVTENATGVTYTKTVPFTVNVARYTGGLKADNKTLKSQYSELRKNSATKDDLKQYDSKIEQTARNIKFEVMEKSVGRRNLLPGSAFRKQGEGCSIVQDGQDAINGICINGGYDGVNCARLRNEGNAGAAFPRVSWDGGRNSNVKVAKGKKYTLSFWAKRLSSTESGYEISTQFFLQDGANGYARPYGALKMGSFTVKSQGEWEFIQDTVTIPSEAKSNYVEVCICLGLYQRGMAEILVCRPMLEEGEEYNGWTLSEQDYDYVGGNLLDGTATLAKTGNVEVLDGTVKQGGMGESASIKAELPPTVKEVDFLQYSTSGMGLKANEDYVLSFYAKTEGNAGKLQCYLYPSEGYTNTEDSERGYDNSWDPSDGDLRSGIVPGRRWKRYWVHWRPTKADPKHVLFRLQRGGNDCGTYSSYTTYAVDDVVLYDGTYYRCIMAGQGNTPSSSSSYWDATKYEISLSQPKLEVGATMTEWTAKRSDMVDKQALYATGINIDSKEIILTASNTKFRDNDGKEMAVIDHDGLRATKIATTDNGGGHTEISGNSTVWYNKDGVTPGIKVFYDAAGVPHFQFCNSEGKVMYDFGPSGLQSFISSTQQAYSDTCYLRSVSGGFEWVYVPKNVDGDKRYVWRKQIPATPESKDYEKYDGCVFTKEYYNTVNSVNWPKPAFLLPDGWYVEPNDGNLPMKIRPADDEGVFDPTKTVYYQTFCYYSGGRVSRMVRAYMTRNFNTSDPRNRFSYNGSYDEML